MTPFALLLFFPLLLDPRDPSKCYDPKGSFSESECENQLMTCLGYGNPRTTDKTHENADKVQLLCQAIKATEECLASDHREEEACQSQPSFYQRVCSIFPDPDKKCNELRGLLDNDNVQIPEPPCVRAVASFRGETDSRLCTGRARLIVKHCEPLPSVELIEDSMCTVCDDASEVFDPRTFECEPRVEPAPESPQDPPVPESPCERAIAGFSAETNAALCTGRARLIAKHCNPLPPVESIEDSMCTICDEDSSEVFDPETFECRARVDPVTELDDLEGESDDLQTEINVLRTEIKPSIAAIEGTWIATGVVGLMGTIMVSVADARWNSNPNRSIPTLLGLHGGGIGALGLAGALAVAATVVTIKHGRNRREHQRLDVLLDLLTGRPIAF